MVQCIARGKNLYDFYWKCKNKFLILARKYFKLTQCNESVE